MSDVLLIQVPKVAADKRKALREYANGLGEFLGMKVAVMEEGISGEVHRDLSGLVAAIEDQTAAMRELAESNRQVVDLVIAQHHADDQDGEPDMRTFLDGSPRDD